MFVHFPHDTDEPIAVSRVPWSMILLRGAVAAVARQPAACLPPVWQCWQEVFDGEGVTKAMSAKVSDARAAIYEIQPGLPATRMNALCWHNVYTGP